MKRIWSGGLSDTGGPDLSPLMTEEDNAVDTNLIRYEIVGLMAYHIQLARKDVIPASETKDILSALLELLETEKSMGREYEDVHSMVEEKVKSMTESGKDLRIFLSRNDQSHYDIRSFYIDNLLDISSALVETASKLSRRFSEAEGYMAGYTHYRQAMPVAFATYFDYISGMFLDLSREAMQLSAKLSRFCPLGYGSGYGSEIPIDGKALSQALGFEDQFENPMYGAGYRATDDTDMAFLETKILTFISRISQDMITFSSEEFGIISLPSGYTTGSSLMPNKRNPDFLEMLQGYASESLATLTASLTILINKGSGYHREFQLSKDKVMTFTLKLLKILEAVDGLLSNLTVNPPRAAQVMENSTQATMEVFRLFKSGMKWKDAYITVGNKLRSGEKIEPIAPESFIFVNGEMISQAKSTIAQAIEKRSKVFDQIVEQAKAISSS